MERKKINKNLTQQAQIHERAIVASMKRNLTEAKLMIYLG
jgi:hypothetical protein